MKKYDELQQRMKMSVDYTNLNNSKSVALDEDAVAIEIRNQLPDVMRSARNLLPEEYATQEMAIKSFTEIDIDGNKKGNHE